jgi:nitroimidazol reductase NimA-like FMN-containing flavoprotein (pyridoxamine 5'-phosphate oxidase superfamily)
MPTMASHQIRELDQQDISALLARNLIGRLAWLRGDRIDILPIRYFHRAGSIYGRTRPGGKLDDMDPAGTPVSFQVDEVQSLRRWRSVLIHGTLLISSADQEREDWLTGLGAIRRLDPTALREEDQWPERTQIFRIIIQSSTGRSMG